MYLLNKYYSQFFQNQNYVLKAKYCRLLNVEINSQQGDQQGGKLDLLGGMLDLPGGRLDRSGTVDEKQYLLARF